MFAKMGNLLSCSTSSPAEGQADQDAYSPGPEELMGFGDLSQLQLQRSCSEEAKNPPSHTSVSNSKGLGLVHLFATDDEKLELASKPKTKGKIASFFSKKAKKDGPKPFVPAPEKKFVDDRPRFGLAQLTLIPVATQRTIATMPLSALLVELGTLADVKSVRMMEVERVAREAAAKVKEMERLEAAMRVVIAPEPAPVAPVSASAIPAAPVSAIVVGDAAPVAPALDANASFIPAAAAAKPKAQPWAKGVGYGYHGAAGNWNIDTYMSGLKVKQQTMQFVMRKIGDRFDANEDVTYELVAQSTLIPFLESYLRNDSMNEILEQHAELYADVFHLVAHVLAYGAPNVSIFAPLFQGQLAAFLRKIAKSAETVEKIDGKAPAKAEAAAVPAAPVAASSSAPPKAADQRIVTITSYIIELSRTLEAILAMSEAAKVSAQVIPASAEDVNAAIEPSTDRENSVSSCSASSSSVASAASVDECKETEKDKKVAVVEKAVEKSDFLIPIMEKPTSEMLSRYAKEMAEFRFGEVEDFVSHKYMKENKGASSSSPISRTFTRRLAIEYADLAESLPIHYASSVWMRVHESNMQYAQMMISGPDGTPYENGLFLFDVHFPPTYPAVPPHVNLQTTGKASVRFNPNLYHCGKVCLSILGTWAGGAGEGWSVKSSTMLQVAVSIQSLIFVPEPYFNEPGYESTMHTPAGKTASEGYSQPLMHGTMKWAILDQLQNPPKGFEDVVKRHFALKKDVILKQAEEWAKKNDTINSLKADLKKELDKLQA